MTNITLLPLKTKSITMEKLRSIAAGEKPAKQMPTGLTGYAVYNVGVNRGKIDFYYNPREKDYYHDRSEEQFGMVAIKDLADFIKEHGFNESRFDTETGQMYLQHLTVEQLGRKVETFIYANKHEVLEQYLNNGGEVSHG